MFRGAFLAVLVAVVGIPVVVADDELVTFEIVAEGALRLERFVMRGSTWPLSYDGYHCWPERGGGPAAFEWTRNGVTSTSEGYFDVCRSLDYWELRAVPYEWMHETFFFNLAGPESAVTGLEISHAWAVTGSYGAPLR